MFNRPIPVQQFSSIVSRLSASSRLVPQTIGSAMNLLQTGGLSGFPNKSHFKSDVR